MFKPTDIAFVLFITTAINVVVAITAWRIGKTKTGRYFAWAMTSIVLWTLAVGLGYAAVPLNLKIFFAKVDGVGYNLALPMFLFCTIYLAGLDEWAENKWLRVFIFFLPISNIILIATNDLHGWVWQGYKPIKDNILVFIHGPGFTWVALTGYLLLLSIIAVLLWVSSLGSELSRRQGRILLGAALFPLVANILYLYGVKGTEGVDWSSVTFSVTGLLFLWALYGAHFTDIIPIARNKLVNYMSDGMVVLDLQDRIIDINQSAAQILGGQTSTFLGRHMAEVESRARLYLDQPLDHEQKIEFDSSGASKQYFDVLISPLYEQRSNKVIGRLIISRDITKRKLAEEALEQRLFEIQKLHKELIETQAQFVEQQRTIAKREERQRMGRDLHDSVNQSVFSLMLFSETLVSLLEKNDTEKAMYVANRIHESGEQALKEIRLLVYETQLFLVDKDSDLVNILKERLNMVERRVGINSEIICGGDPTLRVPPAWKENLYWIVIEALNNSLKHSKAGSVRIIFSNTDLQWMVEIIDDGAGFDVSQVQSGGVGMRTMRERAELLGGELHIVSSVGGGTRVQFKAELER